VFLCNNFSKAGKTRQPMKFNLAIIQVAMLLSMSGTALAQTTILTPYGAQVDHTGCIE
jgi:hypothetical protein